MPTIGSVLADTSGADIGIAMGTCVMAAFTSVAAVAAGVAAKRAGSAAQATQAGVAETKRLVDLEADRRVEERRERGTANVGAELQRISNRTMLKMWNNGPTIATGITVTCLMPGATETDFFERADLLDTQIGQSKKADPADVARQGFDAMMRGEGDVVTGWQNKLQSAIALITPSDRLAEMHRRMAEPGSGKH